MRSGRLVAAKIQLPCRPSMPSNCVNCPYLGARASNSSKKITEGQQIPNCLLTRANVFRHFLSQLSTPITFSLYQEARRVEPQKTIEEENLRKV
uniref:Uncharacterized protein n=1 Tax=Strigamia maritima TaxID=126957 RepID=T1IN78_STRMM